MRPCHLLSLSLAGALAAGFGLDPASAQSATDPLLVTLTATGGISQTAIVGSPLPAHFEVRATDASGNPMAGMPIEFSVDYCIDPPLLPPVCPDGSLYGTFADGSDYVTVATDSAGIARAPSFTAGSSSGDYAAYAFFWFQEIGGVYYRQDPASWPRFQIRQLGGSPQAQAVPALGVWQGLLAAALLGLCGLRRADRGRRTRAKPPHS